MSDILDAMTWAAGLAVPGVPNNPNPAKVVNLSLGGGGPCDAIFAQPIINNVIAAGTTVVIAAGNSNSDAVNFSPGNCNGVITVAATQRAGARASYSNYGTTVEIAAPGGGDGNYILSTLNSGDQRAGLVHPRALSGHQHGDSACRRDRVADAFGKPGADAGAGAVQGPVNRSCVPDRDRARLYIEPERGQCHRQVLRRRNHQRASRRAVRWRRWGGPLHDDHD